MAAPSATARGTPSGKFLEDGFSTKVTIGSLTTISFWERTVKPMGWDSEGKINISTMFNTEFRTFAPKALITNTDITGKCLYDPAVVTQVRSVIRQETTITVRHPDGSTDAAFGFLDKFEPDENQEGTEPMASFTICITNWDATNDVEAGPVNTSVTGT